MPVVRRAAEVACAPEVIFDIVNDIEAYPTYITWCAESSVLSKNENEVRATITVNAMGYKKCFTTHNYLQAPKMMEIRLVDGPFKHMVGFWQFKSLGANLTRVSFYLEFEFVDAMLSKLVAPILNQMANRLVDAFCERVRALAV